MGASRQNQQGQVLLITLLVLTVATTIGLALIGRTRTDVVTSTEVEESARAFSAAEAGIEQALKSGAGTQSGAQTLTSGNASFDTSVSAVGAATGAYAFPQLTSRGNTETLWLVNHNQDQTLNEVATYPSSGATSRIDVCWKGPVSTPALSLIVLYKNSGGEYLTARAAFDPVNRVPANNFLSSGGATNGCGQTGVYKQTLSFPGMGLNPTDILLALRLRPLYADAFLFIETPAGVVLASQGNLVSSTGSTGTGVTRKVVVQQQFRSPPSIFDAAVISQTSFSH